MIYHITTRTDWESAQAKGEYTVPSLTTEGFIHCSTISQVLPVAERFFKGYHDLILLVIEPTLLASTLKWEPPFDGIPPSGVAEGELFPHVFGAINLNAVTKVFELESKDGKFVLPVI